MKQRKKKTSKQNTDYKQNAPLKAPTVTGSVAEEEFKKAPHSFVFHRGKVGKNVAELERDLRRVMEPYTALNLKVRKKNVLKDFVSVAGPLNVSHFMVLTKTDTTTNLRLMRLPRGPTITFKVDKYSLSKDVISSLKRHNMEPKQFLHHPLLVMNNFSGEGMHFKLMATMFQNMFPSINVNKVKLNNIRRCVLLNYNHDTKFIDFRHYNIRAVPVGMSRGVKKLVKAKIPNLSKYDDVSEFLLKGDASESEAEMDGPHNEVELPQELSSRGNIKAAKSAIRLTEIGPRLSLQLIKIEEGIGEGKVLHHEYVSKTAEEVEMQKQKKEKKKKLKEERKRNQQRNIEKKQHEKEALKQKSLAGMKKNQDDTKDKNDSDSEVEDPEYQNDGVESDDSQTARDIEYFKQEVGEEPDADLFPKRKGKKRKQGQQPDISSSVPSKKHKPDVSNKTDKKPQPLSKALLKARYNKSIKPGDKNDNKDTKSKNGKSGKNNKFSKKDDGENVVNGKNGKRNFGKKGPKDSKRSGQKQGGGGGGGGRERGSKEGDKKFKNEKKKILTDMDRMKRSKKRKLQRIKAKKEGKRRNKPRKI